MEIDNKVKISATDHKSSSESNETIISMIKRKRKIDTILVIAGMIAATLMGTGIGYALKNKDKQADIKTTKADSDNLVTKERDLKHLIPNKEQNTLNNDANNTKENK